MKETLVDDSVRPSKGKHIMKAEAYIREVQCRFEGKGDTYDKFRMLLSGFREKQFDVAGVAGRIMELFDGHPDLISKFECFMRRDHNDDEEDDEDNDSERTPEEFPVAVRKAIEFVNKVKKRFRKEEHVYRAFLLIMSQIQDGFSVQKRHINEVAALFQGHPDLLDGFSRIVMESIDTKSSLLKENKQQKHTAKPVHELDLSKSQQVSPSYWVLPESFPMPLVSNRSEIGDQVLNDRLVCMNTNSVDSYSKQRHRTKEEEILLRCEDDRFEMDLLLKYVTSASERVQDLLIKIHQNKIQTATIKIKDYLTRFDLRCIERLYGEHGLEMVKLLHNSPVFALQVILPRLIQKREELKMCLSDFDKVCHQVYAKNQFRLQEKQHDLLKNMSTEAVVTDFQDNEEKVRKKYDETMHKEDEETMKETGNEQSDDKKQRDS